MTSASEYEKKVWSILGNIAEGKKIHLQWGTAAEAKLHKARITQTQKELRLVKKDVNFTKKALNSAYTSEKVKVGKSFGSSLIAGFLGKKAIGKVNASTKDSLRRNQLNAVVPYEDINRLIDTTLVQLDQLKLQIESWMVENS